MILSIIKTLHIISVISWMAGLLYLPRIFVYHADTTINKETSSKFKTMEKKLYRFIMTPAAILTWLTGISLIHYFGLETWLMLKILFVLGLSIFHFYCGKWMKLFANDLNTNTAKFFRVYNEVPTVLMIFIVIFVVFKPFL